MERRIVSLELVSNMTHMLPSKLLTIFIASFPLFPSFSFLTETASAMIELESLFFFHNEPLVLVKASFLESARVCLADIYRSCTAKEQPRRVVAVRALLPRNIRQPLSARRSFSGGIG